MHKTLRSFVAYSLLLGLSCYVPVLASPQTDDAKTEKVKTAIAKLGTGYEARLEMKLKDKTKLKGYVREANEDYFIIVDDETGAPAQVAYSQVRQIKGKNKLNGEKIFVGVALAVLFTLIALEYTIGYRGYCKTC
jgi:hypothetical protein